MTSYPKQTIKIIKKKMESVVIYLEPTKNKCTCNKYKIIYIILYLLYGFFFTRWCC